MTTIHFLAFRDEDADVWVATSEAGRMTTEAPTKEALIERLKVVVPDVLESRGMEPRAKIVIDWQELRTVDQTTLAVA
jgi:hypothetical protein